MNYIGPDHVEYQCADQGPDQVGILDEYADAEVLEVDYEESYPQQGEDVSYEVDKPSVDLPHKFTDSRIHCFAGDVISGF